MFKLKLVLAFVCIFLLCSCQSQHRLESRNKLLVKRYLDELVDRRDYAKAHEIISPEFTVIENGQEYPKRGVDLFKSREEGSGNLSEIRFVEEEMIVKGNTVTARWHATANYNKRESNGTEAHKKRLQWHGMSFYKIKNGLMIEGRVLQNAYEVIDQAAKTADVESRNKAVESAQKPKTLGQLPIIDMHIHAMGKNSPAPWGKKDFHGNIGSANPEMLFREIYERFEKYNIVKAVVSEKLEYVETWKSKDKDNRILRGILMLEPNFDGVTVERFEGLVKQGKVEVFGEIAPFYTGGTLSDPGWQPYLRICEQYDIPVCIHTGGGPPAIAYSWAPKSRLSLGDPYLIEDVLVKYPKLRIYMAHAGQVEHEHALRLMCCYPQLYTDLGVLLWVEPATQRYAREFLRNAKEAGCLNRVMFGSDNAVWPQSIDMSIDYLNSLDFLTEKDKRDIFYNNAVRFLRLKE